MSLLNPFSQHLFENVRPLQVVLVRVCDTLGRVCTDLRLVEEANVPQVLNSTTVLQRMSVANQKCLSDVAVDESHVSRDISVSESCSDKFNETTDARMTSSLFGC